ncbi:hypothetical protein JCM11641_001675 [Rhodosporidiobolus odoratus]
MASRPSASGPSPVYNSSSTSQPLAKLQQHAHTAPAHVDALQRQQSSATYGPHHEAIARTAQGSLDEIAKLKAELVAARGEVQASKQHQLQIQNAEKALQTSRDKAWAMYYEAVSPSMIDTMLRYIASIAYPDLVINHSMNPSNFNFHYQHYPRPSAILALEAKGVLSHDLATTLLTALQKAEDEGYHGKKRTVYLGHDLRNKSAHPTFLNGNFPAFANNLDQHEKGWTRALRYLAEPIRHRKFLAEDHLSEDRFGSARHEAEPFDAHYNASGEPDPHRRHERDNAHYIMPTLPSVAYGWAEVEAHAEREREAAGDGRFASLALIQKRRPGYQPPPNVLLANASPPPSLHTDGGRQGKRGRGRR